MQQKELECTISKRKFTKQYISKVINREYRINKLLVPKWVEILNIPEKYIVDEDGYCKELNSFEIYEIDRYLNSQKFIEYNDEIQNMSDAEEKIREYELSRDVTKLQRQIRKDIFSENVPVTSIFESLDLRENNLLFYEKILEFRESHPINKKEWDSLFKAFYYLLDNAPEEQVKEDINPLVYGFYIVIKKCREIEKEKSISEYNDLKNLFGSLLDSYFEENE